MADFVLPASPTFPKTMSIKRLLIWLCLSPIVASAHEPLTILSWNVESGGANPDVIAEQLSELPRASVFALQEVSARDIGRYGAAIRKSHGASYRFVGSWTGEGDRLLIVYDDSQLRLLETRELFAHGQHTLNNWRHRSPFACQFQDQASGQELFIVTVHLARGDESLRNEQAEGLSEWVERLRQPAIAIGDFNFDYGFKSQQGNRAFQTMQQLAVWRWAQPATLVDTNWSDRNRDGIDDYPDSCLDFAYYAGLPAGWTVSSEVLVRPNDFPDDERTSDHRPLHVLIDR